MIVPNEATVLMEHRRIQVVLLCFGVALAEKKINLEDIERDNLRAESKSKVEDAQSEERYQEKLEVAQHRYQPLQGQLQQSDQASTFAASHQPQPVKYTVHPEEYSGIKYSANEVAYQPQNSILQADRQNLQPLQYFADYQQQAEIGQKSVAQGAYEPQQLLLQQPEVTVGNQIQSTQQKVVTEKYLKSPNKDTLYVNIPMHQLLSYYPGLSFGQVPLTKGQVQPLLHRLATEAAQKIAIPIYNPGFSNAQLFPSSRVAYQEVQQPQYVTYGSKYNQQSQLALTSKAPKGLTYAATEDARSLVTPGASTVPLAPADPAAAVYVQQDQVYPQQKKYSHTQALIGQSRPRYELVYNHPGLLYLQSPAFIQDNSLAHNGHQPSQYSQYTQPQQFYLSPSLPDQVAKTALPAPVVSQNYVKIPEEPRTSFSPPQLPAQNFDPEDSQLLTVPDGGDHRQFSNGHQLDGEPKSLLDTYVPSHVIAAQDSARYRERPIKLEGGFLPSKGAFGHTFEKVKAEP
ncbi:uncharacterized protein LOC105698601 [Orussus abietinus]|uniref:uncharacterized protein LOC105698601 n=1 Tax=Orussus abietinus TaxID=222816 RepID=UPI000626A6C1|nr:uncharacterized protein LOC105698601 [Orussus abietinus]